jgi:hypothetical protein
MNGKRAADVTMPFDPNMAALSVCRQIETQEY